MLESLYKCLVYVFGFVFLVLCRLCPLLHIYYKMFPPTGKTPISLRGNDSMVCVICGMTQANAPELSAQAQSSEMLPSSGCISTGDNGATSAMRFKKKKEKE